MKNFTLITMLFALILGCTADSDLPNPLTGKTYPRYTITSSVDGSGTITPSGETKVVEKSNQTYIYSPSVGYKFDSLRIDGVKKVGSFNSAYSFNNISQNHSIVPYFSPKPYIVTTSVADTFGTVLPSGAQTVLYGNGITTTFTPKTGCTLDSVKLNGTKVTATGNSYTISNVSMNNTLIGYFSKITGVSYTIASSVNDTALGSISPTGTISVPISGSQKFVVHAKAGAVIDSVTVDGMKTTPVFSTDTSLTLSNVTKNQTVKAWFTKVLATTYTVTGQTTTGGTISPLGATTVASGATQKFVLHASTGYKLDSVTVNSVKTNPVFSTDTSLTLTNITANKMVKAWYSVVVSGTVTPKMIYIPAGTFMMGSTTGEVNEQPVHEVTLSGYSISKYEITQAQYESVMGYNPSTKIGSDKPVETLTWFDAVLYCNALSKKDGKDTVYTYVSKTGSNPCSDLGDIAINYQKGGYRLPTEAEWEYAARGGKQFEYATDDGTLISLKANYDYSTIGPVVVGSYVANPYGLFDMSGNVREMCNDWKGDYSSSSVSNPTGPIVGSERVSRGGSWYYTSKYLRTTNRNVPNYRRDIFGFRVVLGTPSTTTYTLTGETTSGGTISPLGATTVTSGGSRKFVLHANSGYKLDSVTIDGVKINPVFGADTSLTLTNITANKTVKAWYSVLSYTINSETTIGGTITPLGITTIALGGSQKFRFSAKSGYKLDSVLVNGIKTNPVLGTDTSLTLTNISLNKTVKAYYSAKKTYTLTGETTTGGTISPLGATTVDSGATLKIVFHANSGYKLDSVWIDRKKTTPIFGSDTSVTVSVHNNNTVKAWYSAIVVNQWTLIDSFEATPLTAWEFWSHGGSLSERSTNIVKNGTASYYMKGYGSDGKSGMCGMYLHFPTPMDSGIISFWYYDESAQNSLDYDGLFLTCTDKSSGDTVSVSFDLADKGYGDAINQSSYTWNLNRINSIDGSRHAGRRSIGWHFLEWHKRPSYADLYIDGTLSATIPLPETIVQLRITNGSVYSSSNSYSLIIDDVKAQCFK